jgi:hypothetical protein
VPADFDRLVELMGRAFRVPGTVPFLRADMVRWKYWEAREDWHEPRSYVVEQAGRLLAHAGIWPVVMSVGGSEQRGAHMIDWAADPGALGAGSALLQHFSRQFDFLYASGVEQKARALFPLLGFQQVAQSWKAARPLRPWGMALQPSLYDWRLPARLVRNIVWAAAPGLPDDPDWTFEPAEAQELPPPSAQVTEIPRPPGFFRYLARCPGGRSHTYRLLHRGTFKGAFLLMSVRYHARLSLWLQESTPDDRKMAYALAAKAALAQGDALELALTGSTPEAADAAVASGFRIRSRSPLYFLGRHPVWRGLTPRIQFQMCDLDGIFFDDGGTLTLC